MREGLRGVNYNLTWDNNGDIQDGMGLQQDIFVVNETVYLEPYTLTGKFIAI